MDFAECLTSERIFKILTLNHVLALRARHRARPSAPAHHAVSNTINPKLVVYGYWGLQGKVNTTTAQMVVYSYWDIQGKVCPPLLLAQLLASCASANDNRGDEARGDHGRGRIAGLC